MTHANRTTILASGAAFAAALAGAAPGALAHAGHADPALAGFAAGFAHPLGGLDHLLAMAAVGVLAAARGGRMPWALPAAFVGLMLAGFALAAAGAAPMGVEALVAASVAGLGLAIVFAARAPLAALVGAVAVAGLAHGQAHGVEAAGGPSLAFAAGMTAATALLHAAGIAAGVALRRARPWAGAGIAAAGLVLSPGL